MISVLNLTATFNCLDSKNKSNSLGNQKIWNKENYFAVPKILKFAFLCDYRLHPHGILISYLEDSNLKDLFE